MEAATEPLRFHTQNDEAPTISHSPVLIPRSESAITERKSASRRAVCGGSSVSRRLLMYLRKRRTEQIQHDREALVGWLLEQLEHGPSGVAGLPEFVAARFNDCLLYTSDAADE